MKKFTLSAVAALLASTGAYAADLPRRAAPVVVAPVPVFTWTGFYAGVNAGYGWSNDTFWNAAYDKNNTDLNQTLGKNGLARIRPKSDGFVGGGQIGYNYQFQPGNSFVVGIEADAQYADLQKRARKSAKISTVEPEGTWNSTLDYTGRNSLGFLGTVRGRVGYAFDRVLIYGTGGLAYGTAKFNESVVVNSTLVPNANQMPESATYRFTGRSNKTQTGYAFGGGIEYALPTDSFLNFVHASAITLRGEYLRYDLGKRTVVGYDVASKNPAFRSVVETQGNIFRAAVNYKFGS